MALFFFQLYSFMPRCFLILLSRDFLFMQKGLSFDKFDFYGILKTKMTMQHVKIYTNREENKLIMAHCYVNKKVGWIELLLISNSIVLKYKRFMFYIKKVSVIVINRNKYILLNITHYCTGN